MPEPRDHGSRGADPTPGASAAAATDGGGGPSIDFYAFLQSLYVNALMALGEVENPESKQFSTNLELARQNIDILSMLRNKTAGNLTPEEDSLLQELIPQLQLLFVKKASAS